MSLLIIKSGLLDTIQDGGRYGYQHLGINPGGVMDNMAMKIANALVGNEAEEAVLEMHFPAAEILFETPVLIALSGADFSATLNGVPFPILHPVLVKPGGLLQFGKNKAGARAYLAVRGGYQTHQWLQSSSTHQKVKAGGFEGRSLQKKDVLLLKQQDAGWKPIGDKPFLMLGWSADVTDFYITRNFYFITGAEYFYLDESSKQQLETGVFTIHPHSDRMGYRLNGETLVLPDTKEMISTAVTRGTLQLLPDGQLMILMADHQTTGGYPRVGHIISSDFSTLAQMRAGEKISFMKTDIFNAEQLLIEQQRNLQQLQNACNFRLSEWVNK